MKLKMLRKLLTAVSAVVIFVAGSEHSLFAEYVFKKDGSIIKCSIVKDEPSFLMVKNDAGASIRINRNDIMRILYTELYMGKIYVRMTSGEVIEGYQVDEDRDSYIFRKEINNPKEFTVDRKKVMFIVRTNPTDVISEPSIEKILVKWSPPFKPAKSYKVYMRENKKGEKFKVITETGSTSYIFKNLKRNSSYEVYVTAIGDTEEESLPSEKIITSTTPYPPEDLVMTEKYSADNKTVTLSMTWKPVTDAESKVKSYTIYNLDDKDRKKIGNVTGTEFVIKDFPAKGRHLFSVVSVNEMGTDSEDVKAVYDAGYIIYTSVSASYLIPLGDMGVIADPGYGGLVDFCMGVRLFSFGIETGYFTFSSAATDVKSMSIIPVLATADYRFPIISSLYLRPVVKAGAGYNMVEYIKHDNPQVPENYSKNAFNPMASGAMFLDYGITDSLHIFGGAEYSAIFQKSGIMSFVSCLFGAGYIF